MKTQRNFKLSDDTIRKLDELAERHFRNRTKEIESLISEAHRLESV